MVVTFAYKHELPDQGKLTIRIDHDKPNLEFDLHFECFKTRLQYKRLIGTPRLREIPCFDLTRHVTNHRPDTVELADDVVLIGWKFSDIGGVAEDVRFELHKVK